jgi:archaellum component FlaF (FlaF/FlaG flagellin family)
MRKLKNWSLMLVSLGSLALGACGGDGDAHDRGGAPQTVAPAAAPVAPVVIPVQADPIVERETRVQTTTTSMSNRGEIRGLTADERLVAPPPAAVRPASPADAKPDNDDDDDEAENTSVYKMAPGTPSPAAAVQVPPHAKKGLGPLNVIPPTPSATYTFDTGTSSTANIAIGSSPADSTVAASTSHVCLTARDAFACYTKSGALVSPGFGLNATPYIASTFFAASGITVNPPNGGSGTFTKDARVVFSQQYQRFVMVFQSREVTPRVLIAVSKSNDPRDGWWTYADVVGDGIDTGQDYHWVGINAAYLLASEQMFKLNTATPPAFVFDATRHYMYPLANLVNGTPYSRLEWVNTFANSAVPCVHDSSTNDSFYAHRDDSTHVSVWAVHNGVVSSKQIAIQSSAAPVDSPQLGSASNVVFTNIGNAPQNAEFRDGHVTFVSNDGITWGGQVSPSNAVHLIRLNVTNLFTLSTISLENDRIFGLSSAGDPVNSVFNYGWPAVASNSLGDLVIGTIRVNSTIFPQQRASVWFAGQPDLSSSIVTNNGGGALSAYHMAGASADPSTTAVYLSQQYPTGGSPSWVIRVTKMLGATKPDVIATAVSAPASIVHGTTATVTVTVMNQGDTTMPASQADLRMAFASSFISPGSSFLKSFSVPLLAPGATATIAVAVPFSVSWSAGQYYIGAVMDTTSVGAEYDELNNFSPFLASPYGNFAINITN